jgi:DNA invertase Pin-like site-specific DNA recombinase
VSTDGQTPENQLLELRRYVEARGWTAVEFVDHGVSGSTTSRPALDALLRDARRRKLDVVVVWRLDRLGRSLRHLLLLLGEFEALGIAFVSMGEGIDCTTPAGKLQMHILGALSEFERERIRERVKAGLARARAQGVRLGRRPVKLAPADLARTAHFSVRDAARALRVSRSVVQRARASQKPAAIAS